VSGLSPRSPISAVFAAAEISAEKTTLSLSRGPPKRFGFAARLLLTSAPLPRTLLAYRTSRLKSIHSRRTSKQKNKWFELLFTLAQCSRESARHFPCTLHVIRLK